MTSRAKRGYDKKGNSIPAEPREKKPCKVCGKDMLVAKGQTAYYHKDCRKRRHNKKI